MKIKIGTLPPAAPRARHMQSYGYVYQCGCQDIEGVRTVTCIAHRPQPPPPKEDTERAQIDATPPIRSPTENPLTEAEMACAPCGCTYVQTATQFYQNTRCRGHIAHHVCYPSTVCASCMWTWHHEYYGDIGQELTKIVFDNRVDHCVRHRAPGCY